MKKVNVGLVRLLQFVVFVIFTFTVLVYFSTMILLPLAVVSLLIKPFALLGVSTLIGAVIAIPVAAYLSMSAYKVPGLIQILVDIGLDLVNTGKARIEAFNEILETVKA